MANAKGIDSLYLLMRKRENPKEETKVTRGKGGQEARRGEGGEEKEQDKC